jgi:hypothetical protein
MTEAPSLPLRSLQLTSLRLARSGRSGLTDDYGVGQSFRRRSPYGRLAGKTVTQAPFFSFAGISIQAL